MKEEFSSHPAVYFFQAHRHSTQKQILTRGAVRVLSPTLHSSICTHDLLVPTYWGQSWRSEVWRVAPIPTCHRQHISHQSLLRRHLTAGMLVRDTNTLSAGSTSCAPLLVRPAPVMVRVGLTRLQVV